MISPALGRQTEVALVFFKIRNGAKLAFPAQVNRVKLPPITFRYLLRVSSTFVSAYLLNVKLLSHSISMLLLDIVVMLNSIRLAFVDFFKRALNATCCRNHMNLTN
jgi:hypothetical protein